MTFRYPDVGPAPDIRQITIVGVAANARVQALVVQVGQTTTRPDGRTYHITYSLAGGVEPVQSNDLLAATAPTPLLHPIRAAVRAFHRPHQAPEPRKTADTVPATGSDPLPKETTMPTTATITPDGLERGENMLTVADLIAFLSTQPADMPLVMSQDAEGNGFSPLAEITPSMYLAESTWAGETFPTPEAIDARDDMTHEDDGAPEEAVRALVLWPTN